MFRAVYTSRYLLSGMEGQGQARSGEESCCISEDAQNRRDCAQNGVSILYNDNDPS